MEFKAGDRVHVMKLNGVKTDFHATLGSYDESRFLLTDCSMNLFNTFKIHKPNTEEYGLNAYSYYSLATDEEDTEEPVIQRINDMYNDVPTHYKADIDVIEFCRQHFTDEEFKGAMKFNLIKYPTRLGRKDDMVKELDKIIDYAQRYKEVLESGTTR